MPCGRKIKTQTQHVIARYEAIPNKQRGYASPPCKSGIASYLAMTFFIIDLLSNKTAPGKFRGLFCFLGLVSKVPSN
jgi:hypothetical protein